MKSEFTMQEQQLVGAKQSLLLGQERNAAQSHELAALFQECRALPTAAPPSPHAGMSAQGPVFPGLPSSSSGSGETRGGMGIGYQTEAMPKKDAAANSMTWEEHEKLLKATAGPLEKTINQMKVFAKVRRRRNKDSLKK